MSYGGIVYAGEAYSGLTGAAAPASVSPIEFLLYDETNSNFLGLLDETTQRKWNDPHNDAGGGEFEIHADHPLAVSQLTDSAGDAVYNNVVRCRLNGVTRYAFIVRENKKNTAKAAEEVGRVLSIAGPGTLAYFQRATVYPERGIGRISPDNRLFNWTAFSFNDTAWPAADEKAQWDTVVPGSPWNGGIGGIMPPNFPDPTAKWIWGSSGTALSGAPGGDAYFRKKFTIVSIQPVKMAFTMDNGMDLYIDNAYVTTKSLEGGSLSAAPSWTQAASQDMILDQGEHLIAVKGHNLFANEGGTWASALNLAGFLFSMHENQFGGSVNSDDWGPMIMHSDSSWKVLEYPPGGPPGMTPGEVLRILFTEAQARGSLPGVTWTFTDANDSDGNAWAVTPDFGVQVGTTYYAMLRQLVEVACDIHMDPESLRIDVFNQRGSASSTVLTIGANIEDLEHQGTGDIINAAILRYAGGWRESVDAPSVSAFGRHEGFLSLGSAPSLEQGQLAAAALFAEAGRPRDAIVVTHAGAAGSGEEPYADYDVADTITVPARDGQATSQAVKAISVSEDTEGNPIFTPEIQTLSDAFESRMQRWLKRMSAGTASGQSENASPFIAQSSNSELVLSPEALHPTSGGFRYATVVVAASDSVNPQDADYVCTGTADQTTINAAIDSLPFGTGTGTGPDRYKGGRIVLMEGTYNITGPIKPSSGSPDRQVMIEGQGAGTILKVVSSFTGYVIGSGAASDGTFSVKKLHVHGNSQSVTGGVLVIGEATNDGVCEDVFVNRMTVTDAAIAMGGLSVTKVTRCSVANITGSGILAGSGGAAPGAITNCYVQNCSGFAISGSFQGQGWIQGNYLHGDGGGIEDARNAVVVGNRIESKTGAAIRVTNSTALAVIVGNKIDFIAGTGAHGIDVAGGQCMVASNHIWQFPSTSFDAINVSGDNNAILGNFIFDAGSNQPRTGIRLETTADRNAVLGNVFRSITTPINDLGTNTQLSYSGGALGDNLSYA